MEATVMGLLDGGNDARDNMTPAQRDRAGLAGEGYTLPLVLQTAPLDAGTLWYFRSEQARAAFATRMRNIGWIAHEDPTPAQIARTV